jgi:DNA-binding GntR family transcriptional regulator
MIPSRDFAALASSAFQSQKSVSEVVADTLRLAILRGQLLPGQAMPQAEIAKQFGVSRAPVRDAFRQLETEGLIVTHPRGGAVVADLTPDEIEEVFMIRETLETTALRRSVPRMTDLDLIHAEAVLDQIDLDANTAHLAELNWAFHESLYSASRLPRLLSIIRNLNNSALPYHHLGFIAVDIKEESQRGHRKILSACRMRNEEEAVATLRHHLQESGTRIAAHLRQMRAETLESDPKDI